MGTSATVPSPTSGQLSNNQIRNIVTQRAVTMRQGIFNSTVYPPSNPIITGILPRNVGIIKRFVVEITATLTNGAGGEATLTDFGLANLISNVTVYDFQNNLRVNTDGKHLTMLSTAKRRRPFAANANFNTANGDNVSGLLNVAPASWGLFQAPQTIAASTAATVRAVFEIPLAYSDKDLRGGIYAAIVNTTMNVSVTLNQNAMVATGDNTGAVYYGSAGTFTSAQVVVTQEYLDQLPTANGRLLLPTTDISTVYELKQTNFASFTVDQDMPIPFSNFRAFYSLFAIYNNNGTNTGRAFGTDINYLSRQTANFTNIFKYGPLYNIMLSREVFANDLPAGTYMFSFRDQPISTTQFGNQQININPSAVNPGAYCLAYWEDMAIQNTLTGSASLAS
jgi:hypothetical protein